MSRTSYHSEFDLLAMLPADDRRNVLEFKRVFNGRLVEIRRPNGERFKAEPEQVRFFRALFQAGDGLIELRALPGRQRKFVEPGDWESIARFCREQWRQNLYFGVAARKNACNGRLENCSVVRAVFIDLDFKTFTSPEVAHTKLNDLSIRPSLVVNSGNGLHCYWCLENPFNLQQSGAAPAFRDLLRRMATSIGADLSAAEPARVLRIPGTLNHKYTPAREVHLVA